MSNIARDNTIFSTLLATFIRNQGGDFIKEILQPPLNEALDLLEKCEIDIAKIRNQVPNVGEDEANATVGRNYQNLEKACDIIFNFIFKHQSKLPASINELCFQLSLELGGEEEPISELHKVEGHAAGSKFISQFASADSARHSEVRQSETIPPVEAKEMASDTVLDNVQHLRINSIDSPDVRPSNAQSSVSSELYPENMKSIKYTVAEKVVGSFLFLRFVVPGNHY